MHESASERTHRILVGIMVGLLGAIEGLYGRTQYMGDWISYLNVSRAISAHDWKGVFNPMWSPGYPALVALARWFVPATPVAEWYAICVLNWLIFLLTYASVRLLVGELAEVGETPVKEMFFTPWATWTIGLLFLGFELCLDRVSRVSPDMLVTLLMVLGMVQAIRVLRLGGARPAVWLGLILGIGCWVKGVFVSYSAILLLLLVLCAARRKLSWQSLVTVAGAFLAVIAPLVSGLSWSEGRFTLGVTGELNYAYYVNSLPHWTNWQGGPPALGVPLHHSEKLLTDLPVFAFGEPFHSTYPPYNELAYWYMGYRQFFSLKNQAMAIVHNCYIFATIVKGHVLLLALSVVWAGILLVPAWRREGRTSLKRYWLLLIFPCAAFLPYLAIHVEDRYLTGMALIVALLPVAIAAAAQMRGQRALAWFVLAIYGVASIAELTHENSWLVSAAIHGRDFHRDSQWKLGTELVDYGLKANAPVALIDSKQLSIRCTWAYISHLRIVAEFGSLPWRVEPPYRWPPHHGKAEEADQDWGQAFWNLSEQDRERVLASFESKGAVAAISLEAPRGNAQGWREVGDTGAWIYSLQDAGSPRTVAGNQAWPAE